jgi:hypothetical protein
LSRFINPVPGYTYPANGKLYFYVAGTNTLLTTYADDLETIPNSNPVILSSLGRVPNIWFSIKARVVLQDSDNVQIWERDPIGGSDSSAGGINIYDPATSYDKDQITRTEDGDFYISLQGGNSGNDPTVTPISNAFWMEINFIDMYNSSKSYSTGDVIQTGEGYLWRSLINANLGNEPTADGGTNWLPALDGSKLPEMTAVEADVAALAISTAADLDAVTSWDVAQTADFTGVAFESRQINATANTVDVTLPVLVAGDSFTYHNQITSTFKVQILNPIETIKGSSGDIAAATNLELLPGNSVQMVAFSATVLSITGYSL